MPSLTDELSKLIALRDSGILTQSEFNSAKARLLNQEGLDKSPALSDPPEQVFFTSDKPAVFITRQRVVLQDQTFTTRNISSVGITGNASDVSSEKFGGVVGGAIVFMFGGWIALEFGLGSFSGIAMGVGALFAFKSLLNVPTYWLVITGGGGEQKPLESHNRAFIQKVAHAVESAITLHRR